MYEAVECMKVDQQIRPSCTIQGSSCAAVHPALSSRTHVGVLPTPHPPKLDLCVGLHWNEVGNWIVGPSLR